MPRKVLYKRWKRTYIVSVKQTPTGEDYPAITKLSVVKTGKLDRTAIRIPADTVTNLMAAVTEAAKLI